MTDRRDRALARMLNAGTADPETQASALAARLRCGQITTAQVELLAYCNVPGALLLLPDPVQGGCAWCGLYFSLALNPVSSKHCDEEWLCSTGCVANNDRFGCPQEQIGDFGPRPAISFVHGLKRWEQEVHVRAAHLLGEAVFAKLDKGLPSFARPIFWSPELRLSARATLDTIAAWLAFPSEELRFQAYQHWLNAAKSWLPVIGSPQSGGALDPDQVFAAMVTAVGIIGDDAAYAALLPGLTRWVLEVGSVT